MIKYSIEIVLLNEQKIGPFEAGSFNVKDGVLYVGLSKDRSSYFPLTSIKMFDVNAIHKEVSHA